MKKTIGILGGMGPLATCDLMRRIIENTAAKTDQEHIRIYVDSNTCIPDRTAALLSGGESPVPQMSQSARKLQQMGADLLVMPCNTAHCFYDQICRQVRIPLLHMPRLTALALREKGVDSAGVLATDGTVRSGIYERELQQQGIRTLYPDAAGQKLVMETIYSYVKAGRTDLLGLPLRDLTEQMRRDGAQVLLLACTELPIAFAGRDDIETELVDPTTVLARAAVAAAGYSLSPA